MKIKLQGPKGLILPIVVAVGLTTLVVRADPRPQLGPSKVTNAKSSGLELLQTLPVPPEAFNLSAPRPPAPTSKLSRPDSATQARVSRAYGQLPLHFEANHGQTDAQVKFLSRGKGYTLFLNQTEAVFVSRAPKEKGGVGRKKAGGKRKKRAEALGTAMRMKLVDANSDARIIGQDQLPGKSNYFIGNDQKKWRTNIPHYAKVKQEEVYPGIDLFFYGNQRQLEYDFVVSPGADPGIIKLAFDGVNKIEIDDAGGLVLQTATGPIHMRRPLIYQEVNGARKEVPGGYVLNPKSKIANSKSKTVGFRVAAYDKSRSLVIDPVLVYSTFLGGTNDDTGWGIAVDSSGNAFVAGYTESFLDFPFADTEGIFGGDLGFFDVFVSRLNADGTQLVANAFLVGKGDDTAFDIALDSLGKVYITGDTNSEDFPTTLGVIQENFSNPGEFDPDVDAFVAKLEPLLNTLVYSTYLGGSSGDDSGFSIAVDGFGNAYVTGETDSFDFDVTLEAFDDALGGGLCTFPGGTFTCSDAFVAKINPTGTALVYSTFLGGDNFEEGLGITVDGSGNAYVTGETCAINFPTLNAFQSSFGGGPCSFVVVGEVGAGDAFVTKINASGSALLYSTYLGGTGDESGLGIAVDGSGNAYVTGFTPSANFPTKDPIQPRLPSNSGSAFVAKFDPSQSGANSLVYSTFLGGTGSQQTFNIPFLSIDTASSVKFDIGVDIAVDNSGNAYITGVTGSGNLPTTIGSSQPDLDLQIDAFVIKLDPTGTVIRYSTYIGGSDIDIGLGIALDSDTNAYVTGSTFSTDFPILPTPGALQPDLGGGVCDLGQLLLCEAFVLKLSGDAADQPPLQFVNFPTVFTSLPSQADVDVPFVGNIGVGGGTPPYTIAIIQGTLPPGLSLGSPVISGTPIQAGLFQFVVQVTDSLGNLISKILEIDIGSDPVISAIPASQDFGSVAVGSSADRSLTVQNFGGGTLAGSASTSLPFSIEAGGSYSLGPGASQVVTVRFSPTSAVASSENVTFTGGGGATVTVTGTVPGNPTFTLTVIKAGGSGDGTVTGTGINCLPDCTETFNSGTPVTLIANPAAGSSFAAFTGDADCSDGVVTMNASKTCTATFSKIFTDDPLVAGATVIKRVQITELREAANQLLGGSGPFPFTEPTLTAGVTAVKRIHITELRTAVTQAAVALGKPTPSFPTDPTIVAGQTVIKAAHITELRAAVQALE